MVVPHDYGLLWFYIAYGGECGARQERLYHSPPGMDSRNKEGRSKGIKKKSQQEINIVDETLNKTTNTVTNTATNSVNNTAAGTMNTSNTTNN